EPWLVNSKQEIRLLAGAALTATGQYGAKWFEQSLDRAEDPYLKINLAIGMLGQRINVKKGCDVIYQTFINNKDKWMKEENQLFPHIAPSNVKHTELIPNNPEVVNQLTRLEVLNLLSIMNTPNAEQAIHHYLEEKSSGISGLAAAL